MPFILVTSLFFLWGLAHSLLDVLNKHFQEILGVSKAQSGLVQTAVYGGYFVMAIPAGLLMKRVGYRNGIITGLLVYAFGAFLFLPATRLQTFAPFLGALFIIALGLACLETAANPYASVLGPPERAAQRLNLSQSFNGLGWVVGPMIGSLSIFAAPAGENRFASLAVPYVGIGFVVLAVAALFWRTKLPEITEAAAVAPDDGGEGHGTLWRHKFFVFAVIAQFFYVAAQTGINSFFINYVVDMLHANALHTVTGGATLTAIVQWVSSANPGLVEQEALFNTTAGILLSIAGMGLFMAGRFSGSAMMTWFKPQALLRAYAGASVLLMGVVIVGSGMPAIAALSLTYFFMSIMFPTIFALGLVGLGAAETKRASSFIVMAIVGGAAAPPLMGWIADTSSTRIGFAVPLLCFAVVLAFAMSRDRRAARV
jgi:FHS family L-fucose permease-like MFS transporter